MVKKRSQFGPILRKDLKLAFTWKTILLTILLPFIMMFLIVGIPAFIVGGSDTNIAVCTDDVTFPVQHLNGTFIDINLGDRAIQYMNIYAADDENINIEVVDTRTLALNASNGIYIPANFTETTFDGGGAMEYRKTAGEFTIQGANFDIVLSLVQAAIFDAYLELKNITTTEIPTADQIMYSPPTTEPDSIWSQDTMTLAMPFAYAMFLLLSLVGNLGRTIGFSKEKEDGTFETMLSITKNRAHLIYSKLIVGILTSIMSILAYFAGTAIAGAIAIGIVGGTAGSSMEGFLSLPMMDLLSYKGVVILLGLGLALVVTMLVLMTVDTLFTKQIAERVGIFIILGFGMMFLVTTMANPGTSSAIAQINPYYWIYHLTLSIVDLRFFWVDGIFLALVVGLLVGLLIVARKAIEREKVLFT
ncbi:MAG: ABC transporter permease [Asgard group archaeon]|nr:ABC transporter permease [Asgard group archaeon]